MKKTILFFSIFLFCNNINSQSLLANKYGFIFGVNTSEWISNNQEGVKNITSDISFNMSGGFYIQIALTDKWNIAPNLLYTQKGISFEYDYTVDYPINQRDEYTTVNSLSLSYVELMPKVSYNITDKFSVNLAPTISFLINSNYTFNESITNQLDESTAPISLEEGVFNEESLLVGLSLGYGYNFNDNLGVEARIYRQLGVTSNYSGEVRRPIELGSEDPSFILQDETLTISILYSF